MSGQLNKEVTSDPDICRLHCKVTYLFMKSFCLVMLTFILCGGCVHQPFTPMQHAVQVQDDCPGITPAFNKDIRPILISSCAKSGCHDGVSMPLDFSVYDDIKHYLDDSAVYYSVVLNRTMPEDEPLDSAQFLQIKCWLLSGHPNN